MKATNIPILPGESPMNHLTKSMGKPTCLAAEVRPLLPIS